MGPKLRKRKNEKGSQGKNSSSPDSSKSSDGEQQKAMDIIARLSQKYLRTRSSTTSTAPTVSPGTTAKQGSSSSGSEYDGDAEYTSDESAKSVEAMSVDAYDYNEIDVEGKGKKLNPAKKGAHMSRSRTRKHRKTANTGKDKENISKCPKKEINKKIIVSPIPKKTQVKTKTDSKKTTVPDLVQCTVRVKKLQNDILPVVTVGKGNAPVIKGIKRNVEKAGFCEEFSPILAGSRTFQNIDTNDSGVFISPQPPKKILRVPAKDTSTPSSSCVLRPRTQPVEDKCFGFEVAESPMPSLPSPVSNAESSTSDYVSMEAVPRLTFDDTCMDEDKSSSSAPALFMENIEEMPVNKSSVHKSYKSSKKKYAKGRYSVGKFEEWANKMNTEFAEIESFELSIEG